MKIFGFSLAAIGAVALAFAVFYRDKQGDKTAANLSDFQAAIAGSRSGRRLNVRPVRFYAMADGPYSNTEKLNMPGQIENMDSTVDFAIHLGDMQDRTPKCVPEPYNELAGDLKKSKVPMLIVPGDNCYYDCANWQEGWDMWTNAFQSLDDNWQTKYNIRRQPVRPENFAITWHRVLFISVHTLWTRKIKDQAHWNMIENQNINWTYNQLTNFAHTGKVDAVVILTHSYARKELYDKFWTFLSDEAEKLGLPFLYLQGDTHRFRQDTPFRAKNILRTIIDRTGIADPTLVTVDLTQDNPFIFERHELSGM